LPVVRYYYWLYSVVAIRDTASKHAKNLSVLWLTS
jgi:hypothetical protein